jgi:hypothetical protein
LLTADKTQVVVGGSEVRSRDQTDHTDAADKR